MPEKRAKPGGGISGGYSTGKDCQRKKVKYGQSPLARKPVLGSAAGEIHLATLRKIGLAGRVDGGYNMGAIHTIQGYVLL